MKTSFLCATLLLLCVAPGLTGCQKESAGTTAPAPNADKAKQFITTLKAMPLDKRQAYAAQHQEEVQNLTRINDPVLMTQFTEMMRPANPK